MTATDGVFDNLFNHEILKIIKDFNPDVVVGVGGYASGPTLKAATLIGIPCLVQEQNSFPGKTNKLLAKKVQRICVAYDGLEKYFPANKIVITGNPTRQNMVDTEGKRNEGFDFYQFDPNKKTVLIMGGSLGARTLNNSVVNQLNNIPSEVQILWQCGKLYHDKLNQEYSKQLPPNVKLVEFISRMDFAYAIADIVVSRAGAISVSELCLVKKPTILVPSPNVAEDHQTKNAMALVDKKAAILVTDEECVNVLIPTIKELLTDTKKCEVMSKNIHSLGKPNATSDIVNQLEKLKH
mgnify:FL=1